MGGGLILESLKFYIDGNLDSSTTRSEKYESFDRQLMPVPAISGRWSDSLAGSFAYAAEASGAWLPKTKTHYKEGGNIYFSQYNLDLKTEVIYSVSAADMALGYHFKLFHQLQDSGEDTNEFRLSASSLYLDFRFLF